MQHDGKINIAVGRSAESKLWKNKTFLYSDFVKRIAENTQTNDIKD